LIKVNGLVKSYGKVRAVSDISLQVDEGAIYGFIGPNGAGKTTTLKVLATLLVPDRGTATIGGYDVVSQPLQARRLLGYMPDFFGVYDDLRVTEYLDFYAGAQGITIGKSQRRLRDDLLELVDLAVHRDKYVDSLSRGMKQRLCLARALVHNPQVLLLDEPASGLDPRARVEMRELLKELRSMGKTILISSHILKELTDLCTHIGLIDNGEILYSGTLSEALRRATGTVVALRLAEPREGLKLWLAEQPGVTHIFIDGERAEFVYDGNQLAISGLLQRLVAGGFPVVSFTEADGDLEEVFMNLTRREE